MIRTKAWLDDHYLKLVTDKTELVIITTRHMPLTVEMQVLTEKIHTQPYIKYLGLKLDCRLNFTAQLQHSAQKASQAAASLSKLMANIGELTQSKRRLLMSTTQAVLLYGAKIWTDSLDKEYNKKMLGKIQRTAALRISSAYRTVSEEAVLVISGSIPIDLLAKERKKLWIMTKKEEA